MPRILDPDAIAAKNGITFNAAWVWLVKFLLSPSEAFYITSGETEVTFDGQTWVPFPFNIDDFEEDDAGNLSEASIRMGDPRREIAKLLLKNPNIDGSEVVVYQHVNDQTTEGYTFVVEDTQIGVGFVQFRLGNATALMTAMFPARRIYQKTCNKEFGSADCGYVPDPDDYCDHTLRGALGCAHWGNHGRFGGCPGSQ